MHVGVVALVCICALFAAVPRASAQSTKTAYDQWIDVGVEASRLGDFPRAHQAFARAHEAAPSARALRGMGVVSYRMGRYARALHELRAALREQRGPLSADLRAGVERTISEIIPLLADWIVRPTPEHATWTIDDESMHVEHKADGDHAAVDSGARVLRVHAEGYEPYEQVFHARPGETRTLTPVLVASAQARKSTPPAVAVAPHAGSVAHLPAVTRIMPAGASGTAPGARPNAEGSNAGSGARTWAWGALTGVGLFGVGASLAWMETQAVGDAIAAQCRAHGCSEREKRERLEHSSLTTYETLTTLGLGLSIASAVTSTVLFVLAADADANAATDSPSERTASLFIGPTSVVYEAKF